MPHVTRFTIAPVRSLGLRAPRDEIDADRASASSTDRRFFLLDDDDRLVDQLIAGPMVQVKAGPTRSATRLRLTFPDGTDRRRRGGARRADRDARSTAGPGSATTSSGRGPRRSRRSLGRAVRHRPVRPSRRDPRRQAGQPRVGRLARRELGATCRASAAASTPAGSGCCSSSTASAPTTRTSGSAAASPSAARSSGRRPDARCAMTTHDPDTGERDLDTLRAITDTAA